MPERFTDEETVNRSHCLCLFGVTGITHNRRCENCPGHRRCPLVIYSLDRKSEKNDQKFSLASSSKLPHKDEATLLSARMTDLKLDLSSRTDETSPSKFSRSKSEPGLRSLNADTSIQPVPHKRKAVDQPESSSSAHHEQEAKYYNKEGAVCFFEGYSADVNALSVEEWIRNKQPKIFQEPPETARHVERCWAIFSEPGPASLESLLSHRPLDTPEDHRSGRASELGIHISGFMMNTESQGTHSCQEGIFNFNDPEDRGLMDHMEIDQEEPPINE